jgi:hypothetical protein
MSEVFAYNLGTFESFKNLNEDSVQVRLNLITGKES